MVQIIIDFCNEYLVDKGLMRFLKTHKEKEMLKRCAFFLYTAALYMHQLRCAELEGYKHNHSPNDEQLLCYNVRKKYFSFNDGKNIDVSFIADHNCLLWQYILSLFNYLERNISEAWKIPFGESDCLMKTIFCLFALNKYYKLRYSYEIFTREQTKELQSILEWKDDINFAAHDERAKELSEDFQSKYNVLVDEFKIIDGATEKDPAYKYVILLITMCVAYHYTFEACKYSINMFVSQCAYYLTQSRT